MQYNELDEITVTRRIERDKGSKYFINQKEVRARDAQTFLLICLPAHIHLL
jgi:chromosome segregation protein